MATDSTHIDWANAAREEILMRVKHRDDWLKLQLLSQAVIWALANGIKLGGVETFSPFPEGLRLAPAVGLAFCLLYYVEDGLIHRLSQYLASHGPGSWETSPQLRDYATGRTLALRALAQAIAFVGVPAYLTSGEPLMSLRGLMLLAAFAIVAMGYFERRSAGRLAP